MNQFARVCLVCTLLFTPSSLVRAQGLYSCHVGTYRLSDATLVDISPEDSTTLRWTEIDGATGVLHRSAKGAWSSTSGWTDRADGKGRVVFSDLRRGTECNSLASPDSGWCSPSGTYRFRATV